MSELKQEDSNVSNKANKKNFIKDLVGNFDFKEFAKSMTKMFDDFMILFDKMTSSAEKMVLKSDLIASKSGFLVLFAMYTLAIEALRFFAFDQTSFLHFFVSVWPVMFLLAAKARLMQKNKETKSTKAEEFLKE